MSTKTTKEEITLVGIELFLKCGYTNVSIKDICKQLNITRPTFYKYVNSKEELLSNFYKHIFEDVFMSVDKSEDTKSSYEKLIRVYCLIIHKLYSYGVELFSLVFAVNLVQDFGVFSYTPEILDSISKDLVEAKINGEIRVQSERWDIITRSICTLFDGMLLNWALLKKDFYFEEKFFKDLEALLDVVEDKRGLYEKYLDRTVQPRVIPSGLGKELGLENSSLKKYVSSVLK